MRNIHKKKKLTADAIAEMADRGKDVTKLFRGKGKMMSGLMRPDIQRVNVDFTAEILSQLDAEAKLLNISRQAVIKTMLRDALDRKVELRSKKKAS